MRKRERVCMYFNIKLSGFVYERGCYFERESAVGMGVGMWV